MARISAAPPQPFLEARRNARMVALATKKNTHHEGHEVHEERKLTANGSKNFQSEISETFVAFVIFVVSVSFVKRGRISFT